MIDLIKKHKLLAVIVGVILLGTIVNATSEPSSSALQQTQTTQSAQLPPSKYVSPPSQPSTYQAQPTQNNQLSNDKTYTNVDGNQIHSPAYSPSGCAAVGATAECRDGTCSFSQHRSGTCSHHGGVSSWL